MSEVATSCFVQIAVAMAPQQANLIYALDDAGGVRFYRDTKKKWVPGPTSASSRFPCCASWPTGLELPHG
jgi:hypothetical protein